jgi:AAA+ ATPase superfamily predicted ATPase
MPLRFQAERPLFVDREEQVRELRELADSGQPHLVLLYGRRRVGKTFLLEHAWQARPLFYFLAADVTAALNRAELLRELATFTGRQLDPADYPTWRTIVRLFAELAADRPLIVVLDEVQYLMGRDDDLASQIAAVWDREVRGRSLVLCLSGSQVSLMEHLLSGGQPLYGRHSWVERLQPFDYRDAARMVPWYELRQQALAYGIFGGTPRYLTAIQPDEPLDAAVQRTTLSPRGEIHLQVQHVIEQERGIRAVGEYRAILAATPRGRTVREIASLTGVEVTMARKALDMLDELGYTWRERNFDAPRNAEWQHWIADNALAFYYRFVHPNRSRLEVAPASEVWTHRVLPLLDGYMGKRFELMVAQAFRRYHDDWGLPPSQTWSRWEGVDRNRRPVEIDIVARLDDGRILTGSIKWSSSPVGPSLDASLRRDLDDLSRSGQTWARQALEPGSSAGHLYVSSGGFTPELTELAAADDAVRLLSLQDLYPPNLTPR